VRARQAELDWKFLADEELVAPWPPARSSRVGSSKDSAYHHIRLLVRVGLVMILVTAGIGGLYARNQALKGIAEVEDGVQAAVAAEQWVQQHAPELTAEMLLDNDASDYVEWMAIRERELLAAISQVEEPNATLEVGNTWFVGDHAAVELMVTVAGAKVGNGAIYRQTRFYRETPQGWLRTQPNLELWGPSGSVETDHLLWRYRRRDEAAVLEIAEATDAVYLQLIRDYGVTGPEDGSKLAVDVRADYRPGRIWLQEEPETRVVVPSPSVYLTPRGIMHPEILEQAAALALLESVTAQARQRHGIRRSEALLSGIKLWQVWKMDLPLSPWSVSAVRWMYGGAGDEGEDVLTGSEFSKELCAAYSIWMIWPASVDIPVYCEGKSISPMIGSAGLNSVPGGPYDLTALELEGAVGYPSTWAIETGYLLKMYTVVDYAVSTYGSRSYRLCLAYRWTSSSAGGRSTWRRWWSRVTLRIQSHT